MADCIFHGAAGRKASGMAEVTLTFSDCETVLGTDYHEVQITRRVFRDGVGEYALNGVDCRLKDIQRLFLDTGIGRAAYSIMEQGKIDQILSSKPEDRRAIFEEAAGVMRFKVQKREAERKLEEQRRIFCGWLIFCGKFDGRLDHCNAKRAKRVGIAKFSTN